MKLSRTNFLWILLTFLSVIIAVILNNTEFHNDLTVSQMVESFGYSVEIHEVTTDDGYIISLHRIFKDEIKKRNQPPVLLIHGMMNSAAEFVNLGPGKALSLLLVDKGYDVWLLNIRGTTWSRKHRDLNPNHDYIYWNFSFHESGIYDLPKSIDYILELKQVKDLHIVAYSQGGGACFVMLSEKPEYASKIRLLSGMAPAVYMGDSGSPLIKTLARIRKLLETLMYIFNINELFANKGFVHYYLKNICYEESWFLDLCLFHFFSLHGDNHEQTDNALLPLILANLPAGVSNKQILHILQIIDTGRFEKFDYGPEGNLKHYGNSTPPLYDLSRARIPVALYYGQNDWTIPPQNVERLAGELPNLVKLYKVPMTKFNHNDFLHAKDVVSLLYNTMIEEMSKY